MAKNYPRADVDTDHNFVLMESGLHLKRKQIWLANRRWNTVKTKNGSKA